MKRIYTRELVDRIARENNFLRDNTEKVMRLCDVLYFLNTNEFCERKFALKGGTAINLLYTNMPRLSVDIDLDFAENLNKDEMTAFRKQYYAVFEKFITDNDYRIANKRFSYSLDAYALSYVGVSGNRNNIKVEINFGDRVHILPLQNVKANAKGIADDFTILTLDRVELYASKINALIGRVTPRDLYDVNAMLDNDIIAENEYKTLCKCLVFYNMIGGNQEIDNLDLGIIENISVASFNNQLKPVLKIGDKFDLEVAKRKVVNFVKLLVKLKDSEKEFVRAFKLQEYKPELLFSDKEILARISTHPMALWRTQKKGGE